MTLGSWMPVRPSYVEDIVRFCNEQSIWLEDGKDHLMLYLPRRNERQRTLEYLRSSGIICGELFYMGIWFYLNENSKIYEVEDMINESLELLYV
jgi:hypothetical protein